MDWHREVKKHQRMFMAVENMAHDNMSVNYIITSAKKPTYDEIQEQEKKEIVVIKLCCIFEWTSTNGRYFGYSHNQQRFMCH